MDGERIDVMTLEARAADLRAARDALSQAAEAAHAAMQQAAAAHMGAVRAALAASLDAEAALRGAVEQSPPELWRKARTRTVHGIKFGWVKQRGRVEFDDEAKVIERMKKLLPPDQWALLVRVKEAVHKPGVYDLTAGDLKRLGIRITDDCDEVVVKDLKAEIERAIEQVLKGALNVGGGA
jgi:hypothetical protein